MTNKPGPSLLRALAIDLLIVQAVALGVIFFVFVQRLEATVEELEARDMREVAQDLFSRLSLTHGASLSLSPGEMARFSPSYGRYAFAVLDGDGNVLLSSHIPSRPLAPPGDRGNTGRFQTHMDGALLWGVEVGALVDGRPVSIQVAEDMNHRDVLMDEIVSGFVSRASWLLAPLFAAQLGFALFRMRRRFRPVLSASRSAADISPHRPAGRISHQGLPTEILPLVEAANSALARIGQAFQGQREFLGNAAHELKTPLAILRARIEMMEPGNLRRELETDVAALSRMVTQLLRSAELESTGDGAAATIVLMDLAAAVADYLQPVAAGYGKRIVVSGDDGAEIVGCAETIGQAITNLVENAIYHTPRGADIEVTIAGGPAPEVRVRDHGPGIPPAERGTIFQRFWRKDRERSGGAGLGLSIVRRAMELHDGTVLVEDAPGGGMVFVLRFPRATARLI
jgi:signal transduction histidine kinase